MTQPQPLESIFQEIEGALRAKLYYAAIVVAVSIPDICATLEGAEKVDFDTYKGWFRDNLASKFGRFNEDDCYELRCGVVHNARFIKSSKDRRSKYDGVCFELPGQSIAAHEAISGNREVTYLILEVVEFCNAMIEGARQWERLNADNEAVRSNMERVVRYRNSVPGVAEGLEMIA